ncbi:hypothetical protein MKW98_002032 [Papaver atlanticum]|uniref:Uncharacterized protein n=1 Tax=Papaver atlanticum TaxID=357466 RepID=A0AAD4SPM1_9MAGN|nr:hypothetical protein MKW98_002032 [Papaver atlanticum]
MHRSCKKMLEMDVDFVDSDAMGLTFVGEFEEFGSRKTMELCPGGNNIVPRLAKSFFQAIDLKCLDCALLGGDNPILLIDWKAHAE